MQLIVSTLLQSVPLAAKVAKGDALWHSAQSGGRCLGLTSVDRMSDEACAAKLIEFPAWDNLVQYGVSVTKAAPHFVAIN